MSRDLKKKQFGEFFNLMLHFIAFTSGWLVHRRSQTYMMHLPRADCVLWITAKVILSLATITLHVTTIIAFVSHCQFRKRSSYILISLAVADVMVDAVTAPLNLAAFGRFSCGLWKYEMRMGSPLVYAVYILFPVVSLIHLVAVSLERLYVILCPFKYRFVKDKAYGIVIAIVWLIPTVTIIALVFALNRAPRKTDLYIRYSYICIALVTICVCYRIIFIKVRSSSPPRRHGADNRDRKLTITLFIVTVVSLLAWLPWVVFTSDVNFGGIFNEMRDSTITRIIEVVIILFLANSLVNPIVYTIRLPEFRKAASTLLCKIRRRRLVNIRLPENRKTKRNLKGKQEIRLTQIRLCGGNGLSKAK